ncbi:SDR family NAD(P)-dependent oxidoreductase [Polaromonas sp. YR568]|uniref:SDR family NAD(P)-dependent oxidoreductase n=1 Tax=Polaromonas sp. YR568 TaxID=1855301 RepID=UPI003137E385
MADSQTVPHSVALVVGAGGGLGAALVAELSQSHGTVLALGRTTQPAIDFSDEASIASAAAWVAAECQRLQGELRLIVVASGFLHGAAGQPERSWSQLSPDYLQQVFLVNTIGPALLMKHLLPLLPKQGRCVAAFISAKVGSIGDNALGGWYGYRASKAALNQLVKTASIELARRNRQALCVAVHPGTVDTALSQPFSKTGLNVRPPAQAAREILTVLQQLPLDATGQLVDYQGQTLPF